MPGRLLETREEWLERAVRKLKPLFVAVGVQLPAVKVSVGWPSKGGMSKKNKVIGQCWKGIVATDGMNQIFISPTIGDDPIQVLGVLIHELIHAWNDCVDGHKGEFARVAKLMGLEGKMTETNVSLDLESRLAPIAENLGGFPHCVLKLDEMEKQRKPQTTRMLKLVAPACDCGYTVRTTQKHIDKGLPKCPHDTEMELEEA